VNESRAARVARIAPVVLPVKVINYLGDEGMKIFAVQ
jgi:hypothetical protein